MQHAHPPASAERNEGITGLQALFDFDKKYLYNK
jgi:hypothetical protein